MVFANRVSTEVHSSIFTRGCRANAECLMSSWLTTTGKQWFQILVSLSEYTIHVHVHDLCGFAKWGSQWFRISTSSDSSVSPQSNSGMIAHSDDIKVLFYSWMNVLQSVAPKDNKVTQIAWWGQTAEMRRLPSEVHRNKDDELAVNHPESRWRAYHGILFGYQIHDTSKLHWGDDAIYYLRWCVYTRARFWY